MFRILLIMTVAGTATVQAQADVSSKPTVLIHATILDGTGAAAQSGMTLVVDGKIAEPLAFVNRLTLIHKSPQSEYSGNQSAMVGTSTSFFGRLVIRRCDQAPMF